MNKLLFGYIVFFALLLAACSQPTDSVSFEPTADLAGTIVAQTLTVQPTIDTVATIVAQTLEAAGSVVPIANPPSAAPDTAPPAPPTLTPTPLPTATQTPTMVPLPTETTTSSPTPQPTPTPPPNDPREALGGPSFTDNMNTSTYWPTAEDDYSSVEFEDGQMKFTIKTNTNTWRLLTSPVLSDFYIETRGAFESCSGKDHFGLIVRIPEDSDANQGYLFGITCDGYYTLVEWDGTVEPNGSWVTHIKYTASSAIQTGSNNMNRIGVMAIGDLLTFYVNGAKVVEFRDESFSEGKVGIYLGPDETDDLTILIDEISYWDLD